MNEIFDFATHILPVIVLAIATGLYAGRIITRMKTEQFTGVWK